MAPRKNKKSSLKNSKERKSGHINLRKKQQYSVTKISNVSRETLPPLQ